MREIFRDTKQVNSFTEIEQFEIALMRIAHEGFERLSFYLYDIYLCNGIFLASLMFGRDFAVIIDIKHHARFEQLIMIQDALSFDQT
jgi:hypothetical protein